MNDKPNWQDKENSSRMQKEESLTNLTNQETFLAEASFLENISNDDRFLTKVSKEINELPENTYQEMPLTAETSDNQVEEVFLDNLVSVIDRKVISTYGKKLTTSFGETKRETTYKEVYIAFSLADIHYAIPVNRVLEIGTLPKVTTIPKTPSWLLGVTNLRGDIFSVVDLRTFLGLGQINSITSRMILVRAEAEDLFTILIVDKINGLISIVLEQIKEPTAPIQNKLASYLTGFYTDKEQSLALFDIDKLFVAFKLFTNLLVELLIVVLGMIYLGVQISICT